MTDLRTAIAVCVTLGLAGLLSACGASGSRAPQPVSPTRTVASGTLAPPRPAPRLHRIPTVAQVLRNDCEAAALQALLAGVGRHVGQRALQREMPRSGLLDPRGSGAGLVWGDPELGFVGRPAGGGVAGGFGVYEHPLQRLARRFGVHLVDLTGAPLPVMWGRLRRGYPQIAWVGLTAGPYGTWRSPNGRRIRVNFGEHAIVLTGMEGGRLKVMNPLFGTRELWSRSLFAERWARLGRRALGVPTTYRAR